MYKYVYFAISTLLKLMNAMKCTNTFLLVLFFIFKAADNPTVFEIRDVCQSQGLNCEVEVN